MTQQNLSSRIYVSLSEKKWRSGNTTQNSQQETKSIENVSPFIHQLLNIQKFSSQANDSHQNGFLIQFIRPVCFWFSYFAAHSRAAAAATSSKETETNQKREKKTTSIQTNQIRCFPWDTKEPRSLSTFWIYVRLSPKNILDQ